ncbi:MAG TPA: ABC transporter permease [Candidatus Sulfomarinibacteraceae bacterium]|nr:ABC transporter permease [Candidatus Sulfomarinibacteraceae bacterium]
MVESRAVRVALRVASALVLGFLYLPLIVLAIYAFNPSRLLVWPPTGFTLHWFAEAAANPAVTRAVVNSLLAGLFATLIALVLGTLAAIAVQRYSFFGRQTISFLLVLPIALPGVVTGVALRTTFVTFGIDFGLLTIVAGHATFCVVLVYNNVIARLRRLPRSPEEASADLGADIWTTFTRVTLPGMRTALLAGGLLAFALSFDEVIVTNFTAGAGTQTIPMWILAAIQRPTELPVVNVVALVLVLISIVPVYLAQRISGGEATGVAR